jgi:hypothetical protein
VVAKAVASPATALREVGAPRKILVSKSTNIAGKPPRPGLAGGGVWEMLKYHGSKSMCLGITGCVFFWIPLFCFALDDRWVYIHDGKGFTEMGNTLVPFTLLECMHNMTCLTAVQHRKSRNISLTHPAAPDCRPKQM